MKTLIKMAILMLFGLLGACATFPQPEVSMTPTLQPASPTATSVPAVVTVTVVPEAVTAAQIKLAGQLKISAEQVTVTKVEAKDWPDGCLGAAAPDEMCTQVVTPGYQVTLTANDSTYTYRTNADGSVVRPDPKATTTAAAKDLPAAVQSASQALAKTLGVTPDALQVISFEAVDWPDGCLGVRQKGVMCTDMITPGYRVILGTGQQQWEFHTDKTGLSVILAKGPK